MYSYCCSLVLELPEHHYWLNAVRWDLRRRKGLLMPCYKQEELKIIYHHSAKNKCTLTHAHEKSARIAHTLGLLMWIESDWQREEAPLNVTGWSLHLTVLQVTSSMHCLPTGPNHRHFCNFLCFPPSIGLKRIPKKRSRSQDLKNGLCASID